MPLDNDVAFTSILMFPLVASKTLFCGPVIPSVLALAILMLPRPDSTLAELYIVEAFILTSLAP